MSYWYSVEVYGGSGYLLQMREGGGTIKTNAGT